MRIAIFSDVHGNLTALDAVLADMDSLDIERRIFAGDLCLVGPRPAACLQRVQAANIESIYGNTDNWILGRQQPPERLAELARWTLSQLTEPERAWLDALSFAQRVEPTDNATDDLLVVHANPQDVNQIIFPSEPEQVQRYGRIRQSDESLGELLSNVDAGIVAFGHLHVPNVRIWHAIRLVNISSVSMPGDGDPRAKYGLFTWQDGRWKFERRHVEYDVSAEIAAYQQMQPPGWEEKVDQLASAGAVPQNV